jgi:hypothetical protein
MSEKLKVIGTEDSSSGVHPASVEDETSGSVLDLATDQKSFGIRLADTDEGRNSASLLINRMYSWRGYAGTHKIEENPNRITLTATDKDAVIGTLTLGIDSPLGILADDIFKEEIDRFRNQGARVCEITKLAFDPAVRSNMALASLFHIAAIYARYLHHRTDIFIEVNPRHRRFYEQMLGFQRQGEAKINTRVNAPAYLLWVNLDFVAKQVEKYGGTSSHPGTERSFYPLFFSPREEKGIINRLLSLDH